MSGYGRTVVFTPPCVSFQAKKNGRHEADLSPAAAIYAAQTEAVQPPDDRTYSAEVTVFRRNLLHHRSARAEFPYTRPIILPLMLPFVKYNFRKNHKNFYVFLALSENLFLISPCLTLEVYRSNCTFSRICLVQYARNRIAANSYINKLSVGEALEPPTQRNVTNLLKSDEETQHPTTGRVKTLPYYVCQQKNNPRSNVADLYQYRTKFFHIPTGSVSHGHDTTFAKL